MNNVKQPNLWVSLIVKPLLIILLIGSSALAIAEPNNQPTQQQPAVASEATDVAPAPTIAPNIAIETSDTSIAHDLSPWGMYQNADIVVKLVMIGLLLASIATWTIFIAKLTELLGAKKKLRREFAALAAAKNLKQASEIAHTFTANSLATALVKDVQDELELSADTTSHEGIKERAAFRQDRLVAASGRKMNVGTGVLATIGSVSPFVGLFGTVWGIMNSFIGIAKSQTTNLAVVAPGIAEALLATAMGLVAAIPAVIIYNVFTRSIAHYRVMVSDISAQTLLLLSRDLDRKSHTANLANANRLNVTKIG